MTSASSLYRPTPSIENVKEYPMFPVIKRSPAISKVSLNTQGNWMESGKMKAAAIFYLVLSVILFLASPGMGARQGKMFRFVMMGVFCANLVISINVVKYAYLSGNL